MAIYINHQNAEHIRKSSAGQEESILNAALEYAASGSRVFPQEIGGKTPLIKDPLANASNDKGQIEKWWGPEGTFRGSNLAIIIEGYDVIDVDCHPGRPSGFDVLSPEEIKKMNCPRATTPGGGVHLIVSKGAGDQFRGKPGIDILSEGRWFTAAPSMVGGKSYKWETGGGPGAFPTMPPKTPGATVAVLVPGGGPAKIGEHGGPFSEVPPLDYVMELLEYIDPGTDYNTWAKVGMAIHHCDSGPDGLAVWDEWSRKSAKYDKNGTGKNSTAGKWETFSTHRGRQVTVQFLINEAIRNGRPMTAVDMRFHGNIATDSQVLALNKEYGFYDHNGQARIVYELNGQTAFAKKHDFFDKMAVNTIIINGKPVPIAEMWFNHPERREISQIGMWMPGQEPGGAMNTYRGFAVHPIECSPDEVQEFFDFILHQICQGDSKHAEILLDIFAYKMQNPMALIPIAIILYGGEGTGKGAMAKIFEMIIGRHHSRAAQGSSAWLDKFSGTYFDGTLLFVGNEAKWSGSPKEEERFKALVTEEYLDVEQKFVNAYRITNRMLIIVTTNNEWSVPASGDSRRYFVLRVADDPGRAYWRAHHALMGNIVGQPLTPANPEYLGKILYTLLNRKVTNDLTKAPETKWLIRQRRNTAVMSVESMLYDWVRMVFFQPNSEDIVEGVTKAHLKVMYNGSVHVVMTHMYDDFRAYAMKTNKRAPLLARDRFNDLMAAMGFTLRRVRNSLITALNGNPIPGEGETKARIMELPTPAMIESNVEKNFPQLSEEN